jgi:glycerate dehydrogenase
MNIVVLDGYTLNPGDLTWKGIEAFGDVKIYERTPPKQIADRCKEADIVLTNKAPLNRSTLEQLPRLKLIAVTATGYNIVDTLTAKENGVAVCNVPGYGTASVAQHVFALLLELTNAVGVNSATVKESKWQQSIDWCYSEQPITELSGKTFGIVGFGNIGQRVARIATAFGMKVIYSNPNKKESNAGEQRDLITVFKESDVVSLHCPLKADNNEFVNKELLHQMKRNAFLINTARGQLIHEADLADALNEGVIAGAALDVLSVEPPSSNNPLLTARNCIITPHNAWMSKEARQRIMETTQSNIEAFLNGEVKNRVE